MMKDAKKRGWNLLWAVLAVGAFYIASNLLTMLGYVVIPKWLIPVKPEQARSYMFFMDVIISAVLLALSFLAYKKLRGKPQDEKAPFSGKTLIMCVVLGTAVFGINTLLDMLFKPSAGSGVKESLMSMIVTGVLFAPLIEELFFRGIVYNFLERFKGGWVPVLLSAAIFGIYHVNLFQAIYTAILGIVLALVYQRTKNILYPIAIHMTNNACACLAASCLSESVQKVFGIVAMVMIVPAVVLLIKTKSPKGDAPEVLSDESR